MRGLLKIVFVRVCVFVKIGTSKKSASILLLVRDLGHISGEDYDILRGNYDRACQMLTPLAQASS